ncbi:hypothetical protein NP493_705g03023 [Ridgeia piscesae]|uniref:Uncharacterized protein n=1 Tax=Ridgeia piscesae TaxID=27915 RepID=A0AAD9KQU4_RIDPI|nr:hypothetical protein NP493_705g03023 [Ridgeia piscesae]
MFPGHGPGVDVLRSVLVVCASLRALPSTEAHQAMATAFSSWEFRKGVHSSGVLWLYWLTQVTFDLVALRSHVLRISNGVEWEEERAFVLLCVTLPLCGLQLALASLVDRAALRRPATKTKTIVIDGFRRTLRFDDVYAMRSEDSCGSLMSRFPASFYVRRDKDNTTRHHWVINYNMERDTSLLEYGLQL